MSFLSKLGKTLGTVIQVAAPVVIATVKPEVLANVAGGALIKHATPINNQSIPYINLAISSAVSYAHKVAATGDWTGSIVPALHEGGLLMGLSTAIHQSIKVPTQEAIKIKGKSL